MSKRLYVGNLPFSTNSEQLKTIFASFGNVEEAIVVSFKDTGKSKGFGFVTFSVDAEADKAKEEMNNKEVEGRKIFVNEAAPFDPNKPRERKFSRPFNRGGGGFKPRFNRDGGNGPRRSFNSDRPRNNNRHSESSDDDHTDHSHYTTA